MGSPGGRGGRKSNTFSGALWDRWVFRNCAHRFEIILFARHVERPDHRPGRRCTAQARSRSAQPRCGAAVCARGGGLLSLGLAAASEWGPGFACGPNAGAVSLGRGLHCPKRANRQDQTGSSQLLGRRGNHSMLCLKPAPPSSQTRDLMRLPPRETRTPSSNSGSPVLAPPEARPNLA